MQKIIHLKSKKNLKKKAVFSKKIVNNVTFSYILTIVLYLKKDFTSKEILDRSLNVLYNNENKNIQIIVVCCAKDKTINKLLDIYQRNTSLSSFFKVYYSSKKIDDLDELNLKDDSFIESYIDIFSTAFSEIQGKYVKFIKANDWLNIQELLSIIDILPSLSTDLVITDQINIKKNNFYQKIGYKKWLKSSSFFKIKSQNFKKNIFHFESIIFKNSILKQFYFHLQPENPYFEFQFLSLILSFSKNGMYYPKNLHYHVETKNPFLSNDIYFDELFLIIKSFFEVDNSFFHFEQKKIYGIFLKSIISYAIYFIKKNKEKSSKIKKLLINFLTNVSLKKSLVLPWKIKLFLKFNGNRFSLLFFTKKSKNLLV